jgi:hypothetical protein
MMEEGTYSLVVAFPDGSESFVNGFAAGQIWEAMDRGDPEIARTVVAGNEEVIRRMALARGYSVEWIPCGMVEWADVTLTLENAAPLDRANPHGLRVV